MYLIRDFSSRLKDVRKIIIRWNLFTLLFKLWRSHHSRHQYNIQTVGWNVFKITKYIWKFCVDNVLYATSQLFELSAINNSHRTPNSPLTPQPPAIQFSQKSLVQSGLSYGKVRSWEVGETTVSLNVKIPSSCRITDGTICNLFTYLPCIFPQHRYRSTRR